MTKRGKPLSAADFAIILANPGLTKPDPFPADAVLESVEAKELQKQAPPSFTWRNDPALAPVSQQLPNNTCVAHAGSRLLETYLAGRGTRVSLNADQFHQCVLGIKCNTAADPASQALERMKSDGVPKDSGFVANTNCPPSPSVIMSPMLRRKTDLAAIKAHITSTAPVIAVISVEERFTKVRDYAIYRDNPGTIRSLNHAVLLIGYDDALEGGFWIIQNSFGREWGKDGFGRIAYGHGAILDDDKHPALTFS